MDNGFFYDAQIEYIVEVLKNSLYFAVLESEDQKIVRSSLDTYYFSVDDEFVYMSYYFDFGPLNLSCLYKYCCKLNSFIRCSKGYKRIVHYTTSNPFKRANAAFLLGSYAIIYLKMDAKDIYQILLGSGGAFKPFVDASQGISQFCINLPECFDAIQKASKYNLFNFDDFDVVEYDTLDKIQNGDMNWLVPRKFLAFIGPNEKEGLFGHPPSLYIKYFLNNYIKTVIRLNNKTYNSALFTQVGIKHYDLFFPDGTVPPKNILIRFLDIVETSHTAIAVHCKAGLGRTGSLIGAYLMKHYNMTAHEAIAWMRVCRPGAVIGQQQQWLEKIQSLMWKEGINYRLQSNTQRIGNTHCDKIPCEKYGIYSIEWRKLQNNSLKPIQKLKSNQLNNSGFKLKPRSKLFSDNEVGNVWGQFSFSRKLLDEKQNTLPRIANPQRTCGDRMTSTGTSFNIQKYSVEKNKFPTRNTSVDLNSLKFLQKSDKDNRVSKFTSSFTQSPKNNSPVITKKSQGEEKTTKNRRNFSSCIEMPIISFPNDNNISKKSIQMSTSSKMKSLARYLDTQGDKLNELKLKQVKTQSNSNNQKVRKS